MSSEETAIETMQTLARYALALDTRDVEALVELLAHRVRLTRDAEESEGIDAFVEAYRPQLEFAYTQDAFRATYVTSFFTKSETE